MTGLLGESLDVSHPSALPKLFHMLTLPLCFCHLTSSFVPVTITTTTRGSRHWAGLHDWFTVIWKRSVPPLPFRLVVLRSDGSLADDAPPHVFKPSRSVMMSMLILDVWPPPSHMIGSTCCTPSTASCLTSRAPWLEWHPFLALQSRGDNLGDWKWQMSGQLYSQGGWCLQPASSPLCLSLLCQTVVSISVYSLWTSTEALVRLPRDWARPIFKHTNYFRYNNQMKQKLIAN